MAGITREALNKQIATNPVAQKYAKRISLLESARKAVGAKPMSTFEKYYAGQLFENLSKGNMFEGYTQPGAVSGVNFKRDSFNIVSIAIQNTILPEIVSVQPMSTAAQLLPILEFKYGTDKGSVNAGDVILDSTGKGATNKNYDGKVIEGAKIGTGITTYLTPFTPVEAGSVKIVAGTTVITDDGQGNLSDGGTINYGTGEIELKSATTEEGTISYTYNNATVPNYLYPELDGHGAQQVGDVTLGINPVLVEASEHKLRAVYALTAAYRINKEYGVNMPLEFEKQVANEMNKERERIVMSDIFANADGGNAVVWSATPRPGVSDAEHVESLPIAINLAASEIYTKNGGNLTPNFIVAGSNVIAYLSKTKNFEANEAPKNGGSFLAGKLGTLAVYQTPAIGTNDFFLGGIGNDFWQAGYILGDYMPVTYTTPVTLADFTSQQRLCVYIWYKDGKSTIIYSWKNYSLVIILNIRCAEMHIFLINFN
jgi:hypothetical protein